MRLLPNFQDKPSPYFDRDFLLGLLIGRGVSPVPTRLQPEHPEIRRTKRCKSKAKGRQLGCLSYPER
jgi:hypothetical protein